VPIEIRWIKGRVARAGLDRLLRDVLAGEGRATSTVGLLLTGDDDLRRLNRDFRGKDRPTDVLSFPADPDDPDTGDYLGDIAVSLERADEQAPRFSGSLEEELARLIVHGVLHLVGYDHHTPADGRRMKARERRYLAGLRPGSLIPPC
jgi:probable rRNA maturation factor